MFAFLAAVLISACTDSQNELLNPNLVTDPSAAINRLSGAAFTDSLSPAAATVPIGKTLQLAGPSSTSAAPRDWRSDDASVATVSPTGLVIPIKAGTTIIMARAGSHYAKSVVTVVAALSTETPAPATVSPIEPTPAPAASQPAAPAPAPSTVPQTGGATGVTQGTVVYDDFTKYADTHALLSNVATALGGLGAYSTSLYQDGYNAQLLELDNSVQYAGHATAKYNQPAGTVSTPQLVVYFMNHPLKHMWMRVKIRYSPGYTTVGTTPNAANAYKIFGWAWQGYNGRGGIEFMNTSQYDFIWQVTAQGTNAVLGEVPDTPGGQAGAQWTDGRWYDYIAEYEQTSPTTIRQRWWLAVDGQPPVLQATQNGTMMAGSPAPMVDRVMIGMNFNRTRTTSQALWVGRWEVVDGSQNPNPWNLP